MSNESSSGSSSSIRSSSDTSSSKSCTDSQSESERIVAHLVNAQDINLAPERLAMGVPGPSCNDSSKGTDTDVEIMEEGEEGKTTGPVPAAVRGQPDLTPVTYRLGRPCITEAELDKYVERGILKSSLHGLCRAPGREEVPHPEPYEAVVFAISSKLGYGFPAEISWAKFCNASTCKSIT
jgi:hypothetical protein